MESFHSFTASHTIYYDTVTRWNRAEINSYSLSANAATETLVTFLVQVRTFTSVWTAFLDSLAISARL
jgi:hypothetical protein